jgi:hypothetical protein
MTIVEITIKNAAGDVVRSRATSTVWPPYTTSAALSLLLRNYDLQPGDTISVVAPAADASAPAATTAPATPSTSPLDLPLGPAKTTATK